MSPEIEAYNKEIEREREIVMSKEKRIE